MTNDRSSTKEKQTILCACGCGTIIPAFGSRGRPRLNIRGHVRSCLTLGGKYGFWTVLSYAGRSRWNVVCECGTTATRLGNGLKYGRSTSCGCRTRNGLARPPKDITGLTFGLLTVLSRGGKTNSGRPKWLCRCICGAEREFPREHFVRTKSPIISCGCINNRNNVADPRNSNITTFIYRYRSNARRRGIKYSLTREEAIALFVSPCHYCGCAPYVVRKDSNKWHPFTANGIDRKDSAKGYTVDNVVPCCEECNWAKGNRSYDEYIAWILRSAAHLSQTTISRRTLEGDTQCPALD